MAKAVSMSIGIEGAEIWLEYNPNNRRILSANWTIPSGVVVRARVWDKSLPIDEQLLLDRTEGQGDGAINIPGNYRLVEVTEDSETFLDLPPYLAVSFHMSTFG